MGAGMSLMGAARSAIAANKTSKSAKDSTAYRIGRIRLQWNWAYCPASIAIGRKDQAA
jgi:hypothetical protein